MPEEMVKVLGEKPADARRLVEVGLRETVDGGFLSHQWTTKIGSRSGGIKAKRADMRAREARSLPSREVADG